MAVHGFETFLGLAGHIVTLNLGADAATHAIAVPAGITLASVHLQAPSSWTGKARLRLSLTRELDQAGESLEAFVDFETAVEFTASTLLIRGIPVAGAGNIRLEVTTVDAASGTVTAVVVLT